MKHLFAALCIAAAFSSSEALTQTEYELFIVQPFNPGGLGEAYVHDVNDGGVAVGTATSNTYHGFFWTENSGKTQVSASTVNGINNNGLAVGDNIRWIDPATPVVISAPDSYYLTVHALDISDTDIVVGEAVHKYYSSSSDQTAIVWDAVNGTRNLSSLGVPSAYTANAVNPGGEIVGETNFTGIFGNTRAYYYNLVTGVYIDLGTFLPGNDGNAEAKDINASGMVVGAATFPNNSGDPHAFRWTLKGGLEDLGILGAYPFPPFDLKQSWAYGINDAGIVVGKSTVSNAASQWDARHAFIWDEVNGMRDLNDLVDRPKDFYLISASAVSNTGWITGTAFGPDGGGFYSGFVLKPRVCQKDLGLGGPGNMKLGICGDDLTLPGSEAVFSLSGAAPNARVFLVVGDNYNPTPLLGGTLVPFPWLKLFDAFFTDGKGELTFTIAGGGGAPVTLYLQALVYNGPVLEFSNALELALGT